MTSKEPQVVGLTQDGGGEAGPADEGKGGCYGDSGGPLSVQENGRFESDSIINYF